MPARRRESGLPVDPVARQRELSRQRMARMRARKNEARSAESMGEPPAPAGFPTMDGPSDSIIATVLQAISAVWWRWRMRWSPR